MQTLLSCKSKKYYIFWACVCSLGYPACNVQAPYCHLFSARLNSIFPRLIKGTVFERKLLNIKCLFSFSLQLLTETFLFHFKKKITSYGHK